jgi:hypothetical protein
MSKTMVNEAQYIRELNRRLQQDPRYEEGMEFRPFPEGAEPAQASGLQFAGPFHLIGVYAAVQKQVDEEFQLVTTPR